MQTLFNAVLREPEAALNHLRAYGHLAHVEMNAWMQACRRRTLLAAAALVLAGLCAGFVGLGVMAWALLPATALPLTSGQWVLLCAPATSCALAGIACLVALRQTPVPDPLQHLSRQWQLDASWLTQPQSPREDQT